MDQPTDRTERPRLPNAERPRWRPSAVLAALALGVAGPLAACGDDDEEGPVDDAGQTVEEAAEDVGQEAEEAAQDAEEAAEDVGQEAEEAAQEAEEAAEDAGQAVEDAAEDVGEEADQAVEDEK